MITFLHIPLFIVLKIFFFLCGEATLYHQTPLPLSLKTEVRSVQLESGLIKMVGSKFESSFFSQEGNFLFDRFEPGIIQTSSIGKEFFVYDKRDEVIYATDLEGNKLWSNDKIITQVIKKYGKKFQWIHVCGSRSSWILSFSFDGDRKLYVGIDIKTGKTLWAPKELNLGKLYCQKNQHLLPEIITFYDGAVSEKTGNLLWKRTSKINDIWHLLADSNSIIVSSQNILSLLNISDGREIWRWDTKEHFDVLFSAKDINYEDNPDDIFDESLNISIGSLALEEKNIWVLVYLTRGKAVLSTALLIFDKNSGTWEQFNYPDEEISAGKIWLLHPSLPILLLESDDILLAIDTKTHKILWKSGLGMYRILDVFSKEGGFTAIVLPILKDYSSDYGHPAILHFPNKLTDSMREVTVAGQLTLDGKPVPNAQITILGKKTTTDNEGHYKMTLNGQGKLLVRSVGVICQEFDRSNLDIKPILRRSPVPSPWWNGFRVIEEVTLQYGQTKYNVELHAQHFDHVKYCQKKWDSWISLLDH